MPRQTFLATDHQTRFVISADGTMCYMQVVTGDWNEPVWRTIVWFRDCGRVPLKNGKRAHVCRFCLMFDPGEEHVKNCHQGQHCVNCGYVQEAHTAKARRDGKARGFVVNSCARFMAPAPSAIGPARGAIKAARVDKVKAGKPGGRKQRDALRNIGR